LTINYTADRSLWVDYKNTDFHGKTSQTAGRSGAVKGISMSSRKSPSSRGAVRLTARHKPKRIRHVKKLFLGLFAVAGGFLLSAQSNGTSDAGKSTLTTLQDSSLSQPQPTFSFDDSDNALDDQQPAPQEIVRSAPIDFSDGTVQQTASQSASPSASESTAKTASPEATVQEVAYKPIAPGTVLDSVFQDKPYEPIAEEVNESLNGATLIKRAVTSKALLAMHVPTDSSAAELQPNYREQPQDIQAGQPDANVDKGFVNTDTTPKTTTIFNHPSIEKIRQKTAFPEGATTESVTVAAGDTLSKLLNDRGVKMDQMPRLLTDDVVKQHLSNLDIGQTFQVVRLANGEFHSLSAKVGDDHQVSIRRSDNGFATASIDLPLEKERVVTSGTIEQSLYVAADQANLKQSTIMELSDIFQWELDFARDIRKGDQFSLIYDRLYREGKYIGDGDILAAQFVRGGKKYEAIRYTDSDGNTGYYSPDGRSKRRTFLRHPVDVVRITSRFDPKRVHPVLHKIQAHKGVDYGSPTGTPIRATADGIVRFAGSKSAYGKTVILSHGTDIRTLYAHMSRISDKVGNGKRVKQGDVIGYVGATGRVTGAHLHYEFQKNGNHVDPLKVELPAAQPLKAELRDELRDLSDDLLAQMRSVVPDTSSPVVTTAAK